MAMSRAATAAVTASVAVTGSAGLAVVKLATAATWSWWWVAGPVLAAAVGYLAVVLVPVLVLAFVFAVWGGDL